ncbi:hypothetical protein SAMN04488116_2879 [Flagellimonas flava]|uniref:Uncharacterized protein n=1 Tax=Flagellimonas flava TaxID=570519 RepID=A0A1M5NP35_9FLAO|nr:hypothetical protein SAMN04488116_2879 [Allomuricauda flava]
MNGMGIAAKGNISRFFLGGTCTNPRAEHIDFRTVKQLNH